MRQPSLLLPDFLYLSVDFLYPCITNQEKKRQGLTSDNDAEMQLIKVYEIETRIHYLGKRYTIYF